MSCVLRAIGRAFDVDAFLSASPIAPDSVFHRGEPRASGPPDGEKRAASGFNARIGASDLDDLEGQVQDAVHFLIEHEDELRRLGSFDGVEEVCLEFGIRRRPAAVQSDLFPADLLWRAGALDLDLVVTHFDTAGEGRGN
jgi:hypothetical protein